MFNEGDKVKFVKNCNRHLPLPPGTLGKEGKVVGSVTPHSCRVKIVYGEEVWAEFRELELVKAASTAPVAKKAPAKRKRKS